MPTFEGVDVRDDLCGCDHAYHRGTSLLPGRTGEANSDDDEIAALESSFSAADSGTTRTKASGHDDPVVAAAPKRRDVQGLRAVAVLLVILYHAGVPGLRGGFVGVDVFFVISGFVITQLLSRELAARGKVSILGFYGRRAQRIIPIAALVTVVTVAASYHYLGYIRGGKIALDGQWAAGFAANLHFAAIGTDYLGSQLMPSPLQHYWSLSVEEQFYVVWPLLLWGLTRFLGKNGRTRTIVAVVALLIAASYVWSIVQTNSDGVWAYFSPLTRTNELMAGALVAMLVPVLSRMGLAYRSTLGLLGAAAITFAVVTFDSATVFPGAAVAVPVLGTAALLAAGVPASTRKDLLTNVLASRPFVLVGDVSFSLYLWHWPILIIAEQRAGADLDITDRLMLLLVAFVVSLVTYFVLENPLRRARSLKARPAFSVLMGLVITGGVFGFLIYELFSHPY